MSHKRKRYTGSGQGTFHGAGASAGSSSHATAADSREDFGNQTLPVAVLPPDFDGVPLDGATYLAMVRKEASTHPSIYLAASNPYADALAAATMSLPPTASITCTPTPHHARLPSQPWRSTFLAHFAALREALLASCSSPADAPPGARTGGRIPKGKTSDAGHRAWFRFVWGCERPVDAEGEVLRPDVVPARARGQAGGEDDDDDDDDDDEVDDEDDDDRAANGAQHHAKSQTTTTTTKEPHPRLPTPALLARFTPAQTLALLEVIPYWMAIPAELLPAGHLGSDVDPPPRPALPPHLSLWTMSLLARLDSRLTSDEISVLRVLARAAIAAVAVCRRRHGRPKGRPCGRGRSLGGGGGGGDGAGTGAGAGAGAGAGHDTPCEGEAGAWMVLAAVAGTWGQSDLWADAAAEMRAVVAEGGETEAEAEADGGEGGAEQTQDLGTEAR